jgi:hypothetical protein
MDATTCAMLASVFIDDFNHKRTGGRNRKRPLAMYSKKALGRKNRKFRRKMREYQWLCKMKLRRSYSDLMGDTSNFPSSYGAVFSDITKTQK